MDDKLKNFLEGKEGENEKEIPKKETPPQEVEENKYDKFFSDDADDWTDKAKDALGKTGEFIGDSLKETGAFLNESLKETGRFFKEGSEGAGKIIKEDLIPKAKEAKSKLDDKVDDWTEKLKDYADAPIEKTPGSGLDESLTETHGDFFSKMEKFADELEGKDKEEIRTVGDLEITEKKDIPKKLDDGRKLLGFDDLDGDGDELIDDAIIEDE